MFVLAKNILSDRDKASLHFFLLQERLQQLFPHIKFISLFLFLICWCHFQCSGSSNSKKRYLDHLVNCFTFLSFEWRNFRYEFYHSLWFVFLTLFSFSINSDTFWSVILISSVLFWWFLVFLLLQFGKHFFSISNYLMFKY